jgi:hypothetical protein
VSIEIEVLKRSSVMKTLAKGILFTGVLMMGANGLMASQGSNGWLDQWYRAKYGRSSPAEEARQRAEQANTAFREEVAPESAPRANAWLEQWYRAKFGRSSPMEEARQKAERANTAFREEATREVTAPANTWLDQWYKAKFGRNSPTEEARRRAEGR